MHSCRASEKEERIIKTKGILNRVSTLDEAIHVILARQRHSLTFLKGEARYPHL